MTTIGIKVESRYENYIDFTVSCDDENLYRYEAMTGKMRKLFGFGDRNYGKAIRGKARKKVEQLAKSAFESGLAFAIAM